MKAYNIIEGAQQRALFLDSVGKGISDIFEQLGSTGADYRRAQKQIKGIGKQDETFVCIKGKSGRRTL